ncbi:hypothetical protein PR048_014568 [Dryococelus australis]|uniref:Uncharacterized protein n=1 Tax=Dryococelus australis TaxID=614101 RepID=A0ABQ9HER8_9NEOP|nr:hypothetical protein PR048_014568 [Dryococelus australis]
MEQRRGERAGETGYPREKPPTSGIVRHDSHMRKYGERLPPPPHRESNPNPRPLCTLIFLPANAQRSARNPAYKLKETAVNDAIVELPSTYKKDTSSKARCDATRHELAALPTSFQATTALSSSAVHRYDGCGTAWRHRTTFVSVDVRFIILRLETKRDCLRGAWHRENLCRKMSWCSKEDVFKLAVDHDKVSTFEINHRERSLFLTAYTSTGELSDMRPVKLVTIDETGANRKISITSTWGGARSVKGAMEPAKGAVGDRSPEQPAGVQPEGLGGESRARQ